MTGDAIDQIRKAIVSERYDDALDLWNVYAGQLRTSIASGAASETTLMETGELVTWSRNAVLGARSQMLNRLNTIHVAGIYAQSAEKSGYVLVRISF